MSRSCNHQWRCSPNICVCVPECMWTLVYAGHTKHGVRSGMMPYRFGRDKGLGDLYVNTVVLRD